MLMKVFTSMKKWVATCIMLAASMSMMAEGNLVQNASFEDWANNAPANWKGVTNSATLTQSSDAKSGSYSVEVQGASGNKRLASQSYTLKAGTYTYSVNVKQTGDKAGMFRLGYAKLTDGRVADTSNDYIYITEAASVSADWTEVSCTFTLKEETEINLIVMNSKNGKGAPILVDDVTLSTEDGGLSEGNEDEEGEELPEGTGEGTEANPYDAAKATRLAAALADSEKITGVYVKGIIKSIKEVSTQYGNATYYITDADNAANFYIYRGKYIGNTSFTSADQIKEGDIVVIYGDLMNYKGNSPQLGQGNYLVSINGGADSIETIANENAAPVVYDLLGRRVDNPTSGIFIVNGKKVVIK